MATDNDLRNELSKLRKHLCDRHDRYEKSYASFRLGGLSPAHAIDRSIEAIVIAAKKDEAMACCTFLLEILNKYDIT